MPDRGGGHQTRQQSQPVQDGKTPSPLRVHGQRSLNGYEATAAIRKQEAETGTHMVIVAITANAMPGDRQECLEAGMDDYLSKPIHPKALRTILQKWRPQDTVPSQQQETPTNPRHRKERAGGDPEVIGELIRT